ncbi:molybdopterin-binding protein [Ahrensia marina]|uniref:molybdopterin-binding protein n=1 Tax=Ahrensia marina TaxID=1514904 RepID=UPI0006B46EC9|nr:molybdopterin-binding protein [Ahrensia marina]
MRFGTFQIDNTDLVGAKLAHRTVLKNDVKFPKGKVLSEADLTTLQQSGFETVTAAILETGDIWEDEAARLLSEAFGGTKIRIGKAATGRVNLYAACDGILTYERENFIAFNSVDPRITCAALKPYERVEKGQMVATVKIIPFGLPKAVCGKAINALRVDIFNVHAYDHDLKIALVQTQLEETAAKVLDKTQKVTAERLSAFGLELDASDRRPHKVETLAYHLSGAASAQDIIIIFGASAICDIVDVVPQAIVRAGGEIDYLGMPVDPGNLILLGHIDKTTIIGAPGCARSIKLNGFDWVLERLCARLPVTSKDIVEMSVGGLLTEIPSRPSPRDKS